MIDLETNFQKNINKLVLYFGGDFIVNEKFTIHQPSVQDILDIGENEFFSVLNVFIGNTTMYRLPLWKQGIDWNKISDFELFIMMVTTLEPNRTTKLLFGDIDFREFKIGILTNEDPEKPEQKIIYNLEREIFIDENLYLFIREGLRYIFNIYPKTEYAKGKTTKQWIIQEEVDKLEQQKKDGGKEFFLPFISFCINHPGFKYKSNELKQVGIVELMDSVKQLQHTESVIALLHGVNSGFVDGSKIPEEKFNFIREF